MTLFLKPIMVDLQNTYGLIKVSGKEAATFLQGQLTCDIRQITVTNPGFGAYCNVKGRIRALLRIFFFQDNYYLQLPHTLLPKILVQLQQYAKFSKVMLEEVSAEWHRIGIQITEVMKPFLSQNYPELIQLKFPDTTPYPRLELLGPPALLNVLWHELSPHTDIHPFTTWTLLDIRAGIPEIWAKTSEQFLPHSLNLPKLGAVSFNKGCYCGQEIIARMEYRATLKRHMFHASLSETSLAPPPGTPLWRDKDISEKVGTVVSACQTSENTIEMLIETLDSFLENHESLIIHFQNIKKILTLRLAGEGK